MTWSCPCLPQARHYGLCAMPARRKGSIVGGRFNWLCIRRWLVWLQIGAWSQVSCPGCSSPKEPSRREKNTNWRPSEIIYKRVCISQRFNIRIFYCFKFRIPHLEHQLFYGWSRGFWIIGLYLIVFYVKFENRSQWHLTLSTIYSA